MIIIAAALTGAVLGGLTARRRKGSGADMAQYAAGYAIAFGLIGTIVTLALDRLVI